MKKTAVKIDNFVKIYEKSFIENWELPALTDYCLVQADARTEDLSPLLAGKEVEALCWGPDGAGTCTVSIGRESRVYTVTCLGDDEVDLDVSQIGRAHV